MVQGPQIVTLLKFKAYKVIKLYEQGDKHNKNTKCKRMSMTAIVTGAG